MLALLPETMKRLTIRFSIHNDGYDLKYIQRSTWALVDDLADELVNLVAVTITDIYDTEKSFLRRRLPKLTARKLLQIPDSS